MVEPADNLQSLADRLLVQKITPPAVLTNDKGDILYLSGKTSKYLEPTAGKTNWNTLDTVGFTPGKGGPSQDTLNTGNKFYPQVLSFRQSFFYASYGVVVC